MAAMLMLLKVMHPAIWVIMTTASFLAFYLALAGRFNFWFYAAVALLGGEIMVIVVNCWHCPLTDVMARCTTERTANSIFSSPNGWRRTTSGSSSVLIVLEIVAMLVHKITQIL